MMPEISIRRGGITFPKFVLRPGDQGVALAGTMGMMVRLRQVHGFDGEFRASAVNRQVVADMRQVAIVGELVVGTNVAALALTYIEAADTARTGTLAERGLLRGPAVRRKPSGKTATGQGYFVLELYRPRTV